MIAVDIDVLERIQLRAVAGEPRDHLVALVEFAWDLPIEQAERLVPRTARVDSARVDCEKPIRDENGKFLGCEPGEGSGSGSGAGAGGESGGERDSGSKSRESTGAPRSSSPAAAAKLTAERARAAENYKFSNGWRGEWDETKDKVYQARAKAVEEGRDPDKAEEEHVKAELDRALKEAPERGHVKEIPREKHEAYVAAGKEAQAAKEKALDASRPVVIAAAQAMKDVEALTDDDDGETFDMSGLDDVSTALGDEGGFGIDSLTSDIPNSDSFLSEFEWGEREPGTPPGKFSFDADDVEEEETKAEAKARQQEAHAQETAEFARYEKAMEGRSKQLLEKATEARTALETLRESQLADLEALKAVDKSLSKTAREAEREEMRLEEDGLLNEEPFKERMVGEDEMGGFTDLQTQAEYDDADAVSRHLVKQELEKRSEAEEAIGGGVDDAIDAIKQSARDVSSKLKKLDKLIVKNGGKASTKAAAPKKPAKPKAAKKPKAVEEEEDDVDLDEEDADDADEE